jgi:hypothetical protein
VFLQGAAQHQQGLFLLDSKKFEDEINLVFGALQANKPFDLSKTSSPAVVAQVLLRIMNFCSPPILPKETFPSLCALGAMHIDASSLSAKVSADILLVFSSLSRNHRVRAAYLFQFFHTIICQASLDSRLHLADDMASSICEAFVTSAVKCKMEDEYFTQCRNGVKNLLLNCGLILNSIPAPLEIVEKQTISARLDQLNSNAVSMTLGPHALQFKSSSVSWVNSASSVPLSYSQSNAVQAAQKDSILKQLHQDCLELEKLKDELQAEVAQLEMQFITHHHQSQQL